MIEVNDKVMSEEKIKEFLELGDGEPTFLIQMLDTYLKNSERILALCEKKQDGYDIKDLKFHLHTLKGSSLNMGIQSTGRFLSSWEKEISSMEDEQIQQSVDKLRTYLNDVRAYLNEIQA